MGFDEWLCTNDNLDNLYLYMSCGHSNYPKGSKDNKKLHWTKINNVIQISKSSLRYTKNMTWFRTSERFKRQITPTALLSVWYSGKGSTKISSLCGSCFISKKVKWNFGSCLGGNLPSYTFSGKTVSELWLYLIHTYFSPLTESFSLLIQPTSAKTSESPPILSFWAFFLPPTTSVFNTMTSTHLQSWNLCHSLHSLLVIQYLSSPLTRNSLRLETMDHVFFFTAV